MSINTAMTALAQNVREISGRSERLGISAMTDRLLEANAEVGEQSALLDQAIAALEGKAAGGGGSLGSLSKYAKIVATPSSSTSFVIENPLGGYAKKVNVVRMNESATSTRKIQKYIADANLNLGAVELLDTSGAVRYPVRGVDSGVNNGLFMVTDGKITLYRYNSANAWSTADDYEVEIWQ